MLDNFVDSLIQCKCHENDVFASWCLPIDKLTSYKLPAYSSQLATLCSTQSKSDKTTLREIILVGLQPLTLSIPDWVSSHSRRDFIFEGKSNPCPEQTNSTNETYREKRLKIIRDLILNMHLKESTMRQATCCSQPTMLQSEMKNYEITKQWSPIKRKRKLCQEMN